MTKYTPSLVVALIFLFFVQLPTASACDISKAQAEIGSKFSLQDRESIKSIEEKYRTTILVDGRSVSRIFGYSNESWRKFKGKIRSGDCVVPFSTPDTQWNPLEGGSGYVLIRKGRVVESFLIRIS